MPKKTEFEKKRDRIYKKTVLKMKELGAYKQEFDQAIKRYAEMQVQYEVMNAEFVASGCKVTEEYTNKSGATNIRKTAIYLSIESMRKDLLDMENIFGLTPKGLKAIRSKSMETPKTSKFAEALMNLEK